MVLKEGSRVDFISFLIDVVRHIVPFQVILGSLITWPKDSFSQHTSLMAIKLNFIIVSIVLPICFLKYTLNSLLILLICLISLFLCYLGACQFTVRCPVLAKFKVRSLENNAPQCDFIIAAEPIVVFKFSEDRQWNLVTLMFIQNQLSFAVTQNHHEVNRQEHPEVLSDWSICIPMLWNILSLSLSEIIINSFDVFLVGLLWTRFGIVHNISEK